MKKYDTPIPQIEGVEVVHVPVFESEDYSPETMARCVSTQLIFPSATFGLIAVASRRRFQLYASGKTEVCIQRYYRAIVLLIVMAGILRVVLPNS